MGDWGRKYSCDEGKWLVNLHVETFTADPYDRTGIINVKMSCDDLVVEALRNQVYEQGYLSTDELTEPSYKDELVTGSTVGQKPLLEAYGVGSGKWNHLDQHSNACIGTHPISGITVKEENIHTKGSPERTDFQGITAIAFTCATYGMSHCILP